jgi:hypothetical protein
VLITAIDCTSSASGPHPGLQDDSRSLTQEMIMIRKTLVAAALLATMNAAPAQDRKPSTFSYDVTVINSTAGQTFTPLLFVTHAEDISLFTVGEPASMELAALAEAGDINPLRTLAEGLPELVADTGATTGLLGPGQATTVRITSRPGYDRISIAAMLIPTNDSFVAVNSLDLPRKPGSVVTHALAYDAGSELNDELCASIPGPQCGGAGLSPGDGEGFVHVSSGIHGHGNLAAQERDWRNPVAQVIVRRVVD